MIEKVENWEPPTNDHIEFKSFMLEQLRESLRFDCGYRRAVVVEDISVEEWKSQQESRILHDIEYHKKNYAEEVQRAKERTAWVSDLRNSLKEEK
jgi:2-polyprenyl-3-methyl-5-hydroxy-6-metoxy-1,4-benzoquinol methylase